MGLVRIFNPRTASETAVVSALLEAHEIPVFRHNGYLASVLPGLHITAYNADSIMVAEEHAADAMELIVNFRIAPSPTAEDAVGRNLLEGLLGGWFVPAQRKPQRGQRKLANFVVLHEVPESQSAEIAVPSFAVVLPKASDGIVLVFNRYRRVWELPGGLIDPGESAGACAARELKEESGCTARNLAWLGLVEVFDGATHFGAVFACDVDDAPAKFSSDEIGEISRWHQGRHPWPLGETDAALLNRFA